MPSSWFSINLRDLDLDEQALVQRLAQKISDKNIQFSEETELIVDCSGNRLGPTVPAALCQLPGLVNLNLDSNRISNVDNVIEHATSLGNLTLESNALAEIPSSLSRLTSLQSLSFENNEIRIVPDWIARLPKLEELNLENNPIDLNSLSDDLLLRTEIGIQFNFDGCSAPVIPGLYFSGRLVAHDLHTLKSLKTTHILSVSDSQAKFPGQFTFLGLPIVDLPTQTLKPVLEVAIDFISAALDGGGCVLVHCLAGASRSASVIIGFLMHYLDIPFERAFVMARRARPCISPNKGFLAELRSLEPELRQSSRKRIN